VSSRASSKPSPASIPLGQQGGRPAIPAPAPRPTPKPQQQQRQIERLLKASKGGRAASGFDACILTNEPGSLGGVSINIALLGHDEIVVASDGLAVDDDGKERCARSRKSCRLNNKMCFVSGGTSAHAKIMLSLLDKRAKDLDSEFPEDDWDRRGWKIAKGYAGTHDALSAAYKSLYCAMEAQGGGALDSGFMLCGWEHKAAVLSYYSMGENQKGKLVPIIECASIDGKIRQFIMGIPEANPLYAKVYGRLEALDSLAGAESVLVEQIRLAATADPSLKANTNILTRRMSDLFRPHWHELSSSTTTPGSP
jgi:hypothetical protein